MLGKKEDEQEFELRVNSLKRSGQFADILVNKLEKNKLCDSRIRGFVNALSDFFLYLQDIKKIALPIDVYFSCFKNEKNLFS